MNRAKSIFQLCSTALLTISIALAAQPSASHRETVPADSLWRFSSGDLPGAQAPMYDDSSWRIVNLPHDWSIEGQPDPKNAAGSGGGFFPAGVGWYRKTFDTPKTWKKKLVSVEFDGVYRNATVYLNGDKLGTHDYGYTGFSFEISAHLHPGKANVLAVRVDNSAQPNSRWYSGSGIYRHVRLVATNPVHVAAQGVFVTTPDVSASHAHVLLQVRIANVGNQNGLELETTITDPSGKMVGAARSSAQSQLTQTTSLSNPSLWSVETPHLYHAVMRIVRHSQILDEVATPFGIRSLAWSVERGFLLNGNPIKLHGGSVHHDNGPLGAAAFDRSEERKVELLKAAGNNAVRTALNPPSPAFLDACDRLGCLSLKIRLIPGRKAKPNATTRTLSTNSGNRI